jgi:hypothetical protein
MHGASQPGHPEVVRFGFRAAPGIGHPIGIVVVLVSGLIVAVRARVPELRSEELAA